MDYFVPFCLLRFHRYEDENSLGNEAIFLNAGKKPDDCKMVARAIFSFQAQNNRELSFKKGDVIYIKKQVGLKPAYMKIMLVFRWTATGTRVRGTQCLESSPPPMLRLFLRMLSLVRCNWSPSKTLCHMLLSAMQVSTLSKKERNMDGAAKAKFNFTAQTPMEVSFLKGLFEIRPKIVTHSVTQASQSC